MESMLKKSRHNIFYQIAMCLFIVSLGMGDVVRIFGVSINHIATVIVLILSLIDKRPSLHSLRNKHYTKMMFFAGVCLIYPIVSLLYVNDIDMWKFYYRGLVLNVFVVWMIVRYIESKADWVHIVKSCILLLIIILSVNMWEIATCHHVVKVFTTAPDAPENVPVGFYNNINDNATIVFALFFVCLVYYLYTKRDLKMNLIFAAITFASLFSIYKVNSRSVILSFGVLAVFGLYYWFLWGLEIKKARKVLLACTVSVITLLVILFAIQPPTFYFGLVSGKPNYYETGDFSGDMHRIRLITHSFNEYIKTFGFGLGPGQSYAVENYPLHNFYVEMLFDYGIIIAGYFFWTFFMFGGNEHRLQSRMADAAVNSAFFVYMLLGVASSKCFLLRIVWVTIALLFCLEYGEFDKENY